MMRMPFGKHKGEKVEDIPTDYLLWVLENCQRLRFGLREEIEEVLDQRTRQRRRQWEERRPGPEPERPKPSGAVVDLPTVVQRWYRELALRYHPDRGGTNEEMKVVHFAHDRLKELAGIA